MANGIWILVFIIKIRFDMPKYKVGQKLTYKPLNAVVTVAHVTPYHADDDQHAAVTVRLANGDLRTVPVAIQDDVLTTDAPKPVGPIRRLTSALGGK